MNKVLGIDLGTTYSCVAYIDESEKPVVLKNSDGELTTPSVVFFETLSNVVVGNVAKESAVMYPEQVVAFVKRKMGKPEMFEYIFGSKLTPEEVSSYILRKVVTDAQNALRAENKLAPNEEIKDVVITCPAYFGTAEREATKRAGEIAGLNVIDILNEPTAAAICYGLVDSSQRKVVLVYDLGGGTFDVTMIEINAGEIKVICTGGDHMLGGKDWDDSIISYLVSEFCSQTGASDEVYNDLEFMQDLIISAENAKKALTQKEKHPVVLNFNGSKARIELTREKFEEITQSLVESTMSLTKDMLAEAEKKGYKLSDLSEVILVGGATRMPMIKNRVEREFNVKVSQFDPDEAVAKGAAIYAVRAMYLDKAINAVAQKTGKTQQQIKQEVNSGAISARQLMQQADLAPNDIFLASELKIVNVSSRSFGTLALVDGEERIVNIILRNAPLPAQYTQTFGTTTDNQATVTIEIMESLGSEHIIEPELGVKVGEAVLELPENLPKGSRVSVTFTLNESGLLEMLATETTQGKEISAQFETTNAISESDLKQAVHRASISVVS